MNNKPLVSVIVPIYNGQKYLQKCISSIVEQSYKNIEIILINDGSTDQSERICKEFQSMDNRIRYFAKPNEGVAETRNMGIKIANGEYIAFVDADDWVDQCYIEKLLMTSIRENADVTVCGFWRVCNGHQLDAKDAIVRIFDKQAYDIYEIFVYLFGLSRNKKAAGSSWRLLIRRNTIVENKIYFPKCHNLEDLLFVILLVNYCNTISRLTEKLYFYNMNQTSVSHQLYQFDFFSDKILYLTELKDRLNQCMLLEEQRIKIFHSELLNSQMAVVKNAVCGKNSKKELKLIRQSFLYDEYITLVEKIQWLSTLSLKDLLFAFLVMTKQYRVLLGLRKLYRKIMYEW